MMRVRPQAEAAADTVPDLTGVNFRRYRADGEELPFLWGVSTASQQVEGGIEHSDWSRYTEAPEIGAHAERLARLGRVDIRIEPVGRAIDHWDPDVFAADLDRARLLGMNAYRLSLEWSRVQPTAPAWASCAIDKLYQADNLRNRAWSLVRDVQEIVNNAPTESAEFDTNAIDAYVQMIDQIRSRGMEPILTLNHMSLPRWVLEPPTTFKRVIPSANARDEGYRRSLRGWAGPVTSAVFERYVRYVVPWFKDRVTWWITLNEPVGSVAAVGYLAGIWPPGFLGDGKRSSKAYFNLIAAHVLAYNAIKETAGSAAQVGFGHAVVYSNVAPQTRLKKLVCGSNIAAQDQWHYAFNLYFLDAVVFGHYNSNLSRKSTPSVNPEWRNHLDFIAPQYYRAIDIYRDRLLALKAPWVGGNGVIDLRKQTNYLKKFLWNDLGWTIYPTGFYRLLHEFHDRYKLPFLITENGMAEAHDRNRAAYTIAHLQQLARAIKDGVDVIGYVHWTIADNFEWASGYAADARFGLFTVDRSVDQGASRNATFPRHITEGALALQYLIANSNRIGAGTDENVFDAPLEQFGTYSADGLTVMKPTRSPGALWSSAIDAPLPNGWGSNFRLYLAALPSEAWLGMVFFEESRIWARLDEIKLEKIGEDVELSFSHHHPAANRVIYTATVERGRRALAGDVNFAGENLAWTGIPVDAFGIWESDGAFPRQIGLRALEGDYDGWRGKIFGESKQEWLPASPVWSNHRLTLKTEMGHLAAELTADGLHGTFTLLGPQSATRRWAARRLDDGLPI
jgi:beta-glucosidase/6-phospho-beta-glucosidase/beta-galactosidase